jgi:hypothetical protein
MEYIRKTYGVPAKRGMRIVFDDGHHRYEGKIIGTSSTLLRVRVDTPPQRAPMHFHPTYHITYLT